MSAVNRKLLHIRNKMRYEAAVSGAKRAWVLEAVELGMEGAVRR